MQYKIIQQPIVNGNNQILFVEMIPNCCLITQNTMEMNQMNDVVQCNPNPLIVYKPVTMPIASNQNKIIRNNYPKIIRKKVNLDQIALNFKEHFYSLFTYRKRFPKEYVFNIHNNIAKNIHLRLVTRDETRSVDKYFKNFSKYQERIIGYLGSLSIEERSKLFAKTNNI